ncbi:MAG: ATP-binding protein [Candidatus Zixiibacteriota bacterium]
MEALTRGLVVVGQSGCGKSFLVGRLVEELVRKTTEKTRLLIIDPNSDFCEGLTLQTEEEFNKDRLDKYNSGTLKNGEFATFKERELQYFHEIKSTNQWPVAHLFGRREAFNLSWKWLVDEDNNFLQIVKGGYFAPSYPWALLCVRDYVKPQSSPQEWIEGGTKLVNDLLRAISQPQFPFVSSRIGLARSLGTECFLELLNDIRQEIKAHLWQEKAEDTGLPQRLFAESRVSFIETETIKEKKSRLETVAFILLNCWEEHKKLIEEYRDSQKNGDQQLITRAKENLKHVFILVDEAQNYAPEETNDPHEKMLGELIHAIAAEGRKYGLHVILATQRPNKIKQGLLGECDNAIIMKMNSRSDLEHLAREMRILDVKLLEPCLHFQGQGNALAVGEMTRMAPYVQLFKSAPRRTREGGVDIPGF